jgi:hypothetical protein
MAMNEIPARGHGGVFVAHKEFNQAGARRRRDWRCLLP